MRFESLLAALCLVLAGAANGCDYDAFVLLRDGDAHDGGGGGAGGGGGGVDAGDGTGGGGGSELDGGDMKVAAVEVHGSGFDAYVGRTVYGRLGPLSDVVVSAVVQPDGTFVLRFPQILILLGMAYLESFIDLDEDGDCDLFGDVVGGEYVILVRQQGGVLRTDVDVDDLDEAIFGCGGL